ncbi:MAG: LysM peptidoglycan-binding domain-containing protein [Akkermansiaceae bacterium]
MKATLLLLASVGLLASCSNFKTQPPAAAPPANPYGVPSVGGYPSEAAPYQPIDPINPPAAPPAGTYTPVPAPAPAPAPAAAAGQHMIQKGDTLWGISRRYGVTVEAIQQANGLTDTNIIEGKTLVIPAQ